MLADWEKETSRTAEAIGSALRNIVSSPSPIPTRFLSPRARAAQTGSAWANLSPAMTSTAADEHLLVEPGRLLAGSIRPHLRAADTLFRLNKLIAAGVACFVDLTQPDEFSRRAGCAEGESREWPLWR